MESERDGVSYGMGVASCCLLVVSLVMWHWRRYARGLIAGTWQYHHGKLPSAEVFWEADLLHLPRKLFKKKFACGCAVVSLYCTWAAESELSCWWCCCYTLLHAAIGMINKPVPIHNRGNQSWQFMIIYYYEYDDVYLYLNKRLYYMVVAHAG